MVFDESDVREETSELHRRAAMQLEGAAKAHEEAARHSASGNYEKAERFAAGAIELGENAMAVAKKAYELYVHRHEVLDARRNESEG